MPETLAAYRAALYTLKVPFRSVFSAFQGKVAVCRLTRVHLPKVVLSGCGKAGPIVTGASVYSNSPGAEIQ